MDFNPEIYLKMRENCNDFERLMDDEDDLLSIEDEIEKERKFFNNRMSGVSILQTCNILNDI